MLEKGELGMELRASIADIRKKSYSRKATIEDIIRLEHILMPALASGIGLPAYPKEQLAVHLQKWVNDYLKEIISLNKENKATFTEINAMIKEYQEHAQGNYDHGNDKQLGMLYRAIHDFYAEAKKDESSRQTLLAIREFLHVVTSLKIFFEINFCEDYDYYSAFWAKYAFQRLNSRFNLEVQICGRVLSLLLDCQMIAGKNPCFFYPFPMKEISRTD